MNFDRLVERIYSESDPGRGVATTVAGATATTIYLYWNDWAVAALIGVTVFPVAKIAASAFYSNWMRSRRRIGDQAEMKELFDKLAFEEKHLVQAFVWHGASVMTWGDCNRWEVSRSAIDSLIQRGVASVTQTADGIDEAIALDTGLFDYAELILPTSPF